MKARKKVRLGIVAAIVISDLEPLTVSLGREFSFEAVWAVSGEVLAVFVVLMLVFFWEYRDAAAESKELRASGQEPPPDAGDNGTGC